MMTLTYIAGAAVLLGLCIFVHELGHLLGGRMVGIKARVFSMGYGKGVWKKKFGDTTYQITLIPFGGYCSFYGEDPGEEREGKGYEFLSASPWRRIVTVIMGPMFNLFFGILLFYIMNVVGYSEETNRILIPGEFQTAGQESPAHAAGLRTGDVILSIDGKGVQTFSDIQEDVFFSEGKAIKVRALREGKELNFSVQPKLAGPSGRYTMGVMPYTRGIAITHVVKGGPAVKAGLKKGDVIVSANGTKLFSPGEFSGILAKKRGEALSFSYLRDGETRKGTFVPEKVKIFMIKSPDGKKILHSIVGNGVFQAKIDSGLVRIDGKPILSYGEFQKDIATGKSHDLVLDIAGERYRGSVEVMERYMVGVSIGFVFEKVQVSYGAVESLSRALVEPWDFIVMNLKGFSMLFRGEMDVRENLSGPIRIAKIAGDVLYERGVADFVLLMAKISILLMIMNLLPIPAVDGSHLLFYLIEAIRGKPISEPIMARIQGFGVLFLIILGVFVILNDISMLPFVQDFFK